MSEIRHRNPSQCVGKIAYQSGHAAAKVVKALAKRNNASRRNVNSYRCRLCSCWHIGVNPSQNHKELMKIRLRFERRHPPS
jgi:hypothetical protein